MSIEPYRGEEYLDGSSQLETGSGDGVSVDTSNILEVESKDGTRLLANYFINRSSDESQRRVFRDLIEYTGVEEELMEETGIPHDGMLDKIENGFLDSRHRGGIAFWTEEPELDAYEEYLREMRNNSSLEDTESVFTRIYSLLDNREKVNSSMEGQIDDCLPDINYTLYVDMGGRSPATVSGQVPVGTDIYKGALREFGRTMLDQ